MTDKKDIVDDIFSRVKKILGNYLNGQIVIQLEQEEGRIRQDWGGTEPYISKKREREKRKAQAMEELKRCGSVKDVSKKTGISMTVLYETLRKRKKTALP